MPKVDGNSTSHSSQAGTKFPRKYALYAMFILASIFAVGCSNEPADKPFQQRIIDKEFSLAVKNLGHQVDARISSMKLIAKTVANDTYIHAWVNNGFSQDEESLLVDKLAFLVQEYALTSASFADKNTNKYWNNEGFLRILAPETDTWYFAYLNSNEQDLVSVYHDKNKKRVDLYVNYQQIGGNGLSGIATSFNGMLDTLNASFLAKHGDIYLADKSGKVQVHVNSDVAGSATLQGMFDESTAQDLLANSAPGFMAIIETKDSLLGSTYVPSMGWFLIVAVERDSFLGES